MALRKARVALDIFTALYKNKLSTTPQMAEQAGQNRIVERLIHFLTFTSAMPTPAGRWDDSAQSSKL